MTLFAGDFAIEVRLFCRSGKRRSYYITRLRKN